MANTTSVFRLKCGYVLSLHCKERRSSKRCTNATRIEYNSLQSCVERQESIKQKNRDINLSFIKRNVLMKIFDDLIVQNEVMKV